MPNKTIQSTIYFEGKRMVVHFVEKDRLEAQRIKEKLGFNSFSGLIEYVSRKYNKDRKHFKFTAGYLRYCLSKFIELQQNKNA